LWRLFDVGHQAVEVDVGVDFALVLAVIVLRLLISKTFTISVETFLTCTSSVNRGVGCELRLVGECEIDVESVP